MARQNKVKYARLKQAGLFNEEAERIRDELFLEHEDFFDAYDLLQVRYELLRGHLIEGRSVVRLCECYGISRQTFYNLLEKFQEGGCAGLFPQRPGPKGASKLTPEVLSFVCGELERNAEISGAKLSSAIEARFEISVHRRTLEKLLAELRRKKWLSFPRP